MSDPPLDPVLIIAHLSRSPNHLFKAMITISDPPKPPTQSLENRESSVGMLDRLPLELMSLVLDLLDVQSLCCFSTVSFRGSMFVKGHPAYWDMTNFAPQALLALGKTGLLGNHSIAELHHALRSQRCTDCPEYGAFLFLPTCQRCCWDCLCNRPSLRMLLARDAAQYFDLTDKHLRSLPSLRVIPGTYGTGGSPTPGGSRLLSVRAIKALALEVHGSEARLRQAVERRCKRPEVVDVASYYLLDTAPQSSQGYQGVQWQDGFFGMAVIPFPSLSKAGRIEWGLWCRGCELIFRKRHLTRLVPNAPAAAMIPADVLAALIPPGKVLGTVLLEYERRARSKVDFLSHVKQCWGAWQFVPQLEPVKDSARAMKDQDSPAKA